MSIRGSIRLWTNGAERGLWWHELALPGAEQKRHMLLTKEVRRAINGPHDTVNEERRFSELRGDLDAFVEGRIISIAVNPYDKAKNAYLARVDPIEKEIWDIRSSDPRPAIRVLGCFAEVDIFVCLIWAFRTDLDGPGGRLWEGFIQRAEHAWNHLFFGEKPHSGGDASDYVSQDFYLV